MTYAYRYGASLYLNITNLCPNRCEFCVRNEVDGLGGEVLWLDHEPDVEEVVQAVENAGNYDEVVFCGYGEPLERPETVLEIARVLKKRNIRLRINTNGLSDLINSRHVLPELQGWIDAISISLNAENAEKYDAICHSDFGLAAWPAIIEFTKEAKLYIPDVTLSVVGFAGVDIEACGSISHSLGVKFRVR